MITATLDGSLLAAVLLDEEPADESYSPPRTIRRADYVESLALAVLEDRGETLPMPSWPVAA